MDSLVQMCDLQKSNINEVIYAGESNSMATCPLEISNFATLELVVSFSMLTVNADDQPVMKQFHKPGDEKRTPMIIRPDLHEAWLSADIEKAAELMYWQHMPELVATDAPRQA